MVLLNIDLYLIPHRLNGIEVRGERWLLAGLDTTFREVVKSAGCSVGRNVILHRDCREPLKTL